MTTPTDEINTGLDTASGDTGARQKPIGLIQHRIYVDGVKALKSRLTGLSPGPLVRLCGLTGAGKTEIALAVAKELAGPVHSWPERTLPVAYTRATKSDRGRFSAKEFAHKTHHSVANPDPSWMIPNHDVGLEAEIERRVEHLRKTSIWKLLHSRSTEESFRNGCVNLWRDYKVRYHFFDDVHAFSSVSGNVKPSDLVQAWVCAAESANVTLVFAGTAAMHALWDGEGEMERRSKPLFLPRYDMQLESDRRAFISMVLALARRYQWDGLDVTEHFDHIYYLSCGTFGQVLALFERAFDHARAENRTAISRADFQSALPNIDSVSESIRRAYVYDALARPAPFSAIKDAYHEIMAKKKK